MLVVTRLEPAILRGKSGVKALGELLLVGVAEAGLSASLSLLFDAGGVDFGRGRSPTVASSYKISLKGKINACTNIIIGLTINDQQNAS